MAENPLLPNVRLKELYALMQRCRTLTQRTRPTPPRLEAVFSATMLHLVPGDICMPLPGNAISALLAAEYLSRSPKDLQAQQPPHQRLAVAAGAALALKLASGHKLALAYTHTGASTARSEQGWAEAITYAHQANLPLILVCTAIEAPSRTPNPRAIHWQSISRLAKALKLPVVTVDGTDAVAIYRVMQESAHRARQDNSPAVIWCILPPSSANAPSNDPIRTMQRYLRVRSLLPATPTKKPLI